MKQSFDVIILGDTNSHIGYQDINVISSDSFGQFLLHKETNSNGDDMIYMAKLLDLNVLTTMNHRSTRVTWHSRGVHSQIDHIFSMKHSNLKIISIKGKWMKYQSDHKMISCIVIYRHDISKFSPKKYPTYSIYRTVQWDYKFLSIPQIQQNFNSFVGQELKKYREINKEKIPWGQLCSIACFCANKLVLKRQRVYTADERIAYQEIQRLLYNHYQPRLIDKNHNYDNLIDDSPPIMPPGFRNILKSAQRKLINLRVTTTERENLHQLINNIQDQNLHPSQRVQQLMRFLKGFKRSQICSNNISLKHWEDDLKNFIGPEIKLMIEDDYHPLPPPFSFQSFMIVVNNMKNGKASGLDKLSIEMLKSSEELQYAFFKIIQEVYITNNVPIEWQQTYAYPIPKITSPQTTNDMRKITLTSVGYKVYVGLLKGKNIKLKKFLIKESNENSNTKKKHF